MPAGAMPLLLALLLFRLLISRCCLSLAATVLVAGCQIAQSIFGGVRPLSFLIMFIAEVRFACHIVLRGRADSMLSGAALRGSSTTLLQLSAAPPFLSTTSWHVLRNLPA